MHHQDEVRARRDAVALQHRGLGLRQLLEGVHRFGRLHIQRDLDDGRECGAQPGRVDDGHLARDDAGFHQTPHPPQASGRRGMHPRGQFLVRQRAVLLHQFQDTEIQVVQNERGRHFLHD